MVNYDSMASAAELAALFTLYLHYKHKNEWPKVNEFDQEFLKLLLRRGWAKVENGYVILTPAGWKEFEESERDDE